MTLVHADSLVETVDEVNDAFFWGRPISGREKERAIKLITSRLALPGAYANMFAPTDKDLGNSFHLFTGETVKAGPGMRHIIGEEACRSLLLLGREDPGVLKTVAKAGERVLGELPSHRSRAPATSEGPIRLAYGMYCCPTCTCALWRHVSSLRHDQYGEYLAAGLRSLRARRDQSGQWNGWPFYYTLLTLTTVDESLAIAELQHAAKFCEKRLGQRFGGNPKFAQRRKALLEQVLKKV